MEIIECCGGGIFRCTSCGEYFYPGEVIQTLCEEEGSSEAGEPPVEGPHLEEGDKQRN